jgi:hypothetical protein
MTRPVPPPPEPLHVRTARALAAVVHRRNNEWSEDTTFSLWRRFSAELGAGIPLTADSFRSAAGISARRAITERAIDDYFSYVTDPTNFEADVVDTYTLLRSLMHAGLSELTIFKVGEGQGVNVRTFLLGRTGDGNLAGIQAPEIQT